MMNRNVTLLAGSALALLMTAMPAAVAATALGRPGVPEPRAGSVILAQDDPGGDAQGEDAGPAPQAAPDEPAAEPPPRKKRQPAAEQSAEPAPEPQAAPTAEPAPQAAPDEPAAEPPPRKKRQPEAEQSAEPAPEPQAAPTAEPAPQAAPDEPAAEPPPRKKRQPEAEQSAEPAPEPQAAPTAEPAPQAAPDEQPAQPMPAEPPAAAEPPQAAPEPAPSAQPEAPAKPEAPAAEPPAKPAPPQPDAAPAEQPPATDAPAQVTPEQAPAPGDAPPQPTPEAAPQPAPAPQGEPEAAPVPEPAPGQPAPSPQGETGQTQPGGEVKPGATSPETPAGESPAESPVPPGEGTASQPENAAPVLDSDKEAPAPAPTGEATAEPAAPAEPPAPPPADDRAAQEAARPAEIEPVTAERGRRVSTPPPAERRPDGVDVVREIGDRILLQFNNQVIVESSDRPRLSRGARDVYYEDLPRGRTRETVVRDDGSQVVTIRNRNGDIMRRSRITPDGREYVLAYVDDRDYDRLEDWRDPGRDLPPMRLDVPVSRYILDAGRVEDPDAYYDFLEQPPVERVERLYSLDEVKRSARLRDKVPRVELDTVTFDFGSAAIGEGEIPRLQGVAEAIERLLENNPAETFLIEGHTDAVGSDAANLALSDRRAESVADALTNVFGISPENLATQGYGERFLKIKTEAQERLNRRVVIRRITPLVAPVASAN